VWFGCAEVQLSCWASWQEDGYWFIVAAAPANQLPRYVLVKFQLTDYDFTVTLEGGSHGDSVGNTVEENASIFSLI